MSTLIESLRRLLLSGRTTEQKIRQLQETGTITQAEMEYILEE